MSSGQHLRVGMACGTAHRTGQTIFKFLRQKSCLSIQKTVKNLLIVFILLLFFLTRCLILFLLFFCCVIKISKFPDFCLKPIQFCLSLCPFFFLRHCFLKVNLRIFQCGTFLFQLFHVFLNLLFLPDIRFLLCPGFFQLCTDFIQFFLKLFQKLIFFQLFLFFTDQKSQLFAFLVCILIFFCLCCRFLKLRKKFLKLFFCKSFFLFQTLFL